MTKQNKAAGTARELKVVKLMRDRGFVAFRTPASLGVCDVVAMRPWTGVRRFSDESLTHPMPVADVRLIEVKANIGNPYMNFRGSDREALRLAAKAAGATAWLFWWPPHGELREIPSSEWPEQPWADAEEVAA